MPRGTLRRIKYDINDPEIARLYIKLCNMILEKDFLNLDTINLIKGTQKIDIVDIIKRIRTHKQRRNINV